MINLGLFKQNKITKQFAISDSSIRIDIFKKINQQKRKIDEKLWIDIRSKLKQKNFCSKFIQQIHKKLMEDCIKLFENGSIQILLFKTGQYYKQNQNINLMFSQYQITCLEMINNQKYSGFIYKYGEQHKEDQKKEVYSGTFIIKDKKLVLDGQGTYIKCVKQVQTEKKFAHKFEGQFKHEEFPIGKKYTYQIKQSENYQEVLTQQYIGQFKNMRYHGQGQLQSKKQKLRYKGMFEDGRIFQITQKKKIQ